MTKNKKTLQPGYENSFKINYLTLISKARSNEGRDDT
jgi:hypothetical protein